MRITFETGQLTPSFVVIMKRFFIALIMSILIACAHQKSRGEHFVAFGDFEGLEQLVSDFYDRLKKDKRIGAFFAESNEQLIKEELTFQFCELLEGPCEFQGANMKAVHKGLGIKREHFNALVEVLQQTMNDYSIAYQSQNFLLAQLAPMYRDVVDE